MSGATFKRAWLTPDTAPTATRCRRVRIPDDEVWIAAVSGALTPLIYAYNWEQFGDLTPEEAAARAQTMVLAYFQDDCMIGAIFPYASAVPPNGCIPCDGSTFARADYPELYDALDSLYIVDADTLKTPDLRSRFVIAAGNGIGLKNYDVGDTGGDETVVLTEGQLAAHTHTAQPHTHTNTPHTHGEITAVISAAAPPVPPAIIPSAVVGGGITTASGVIIDSAVVTIDSTGGDDPHPNMPPFYALKYAMVAR